MRYGFFAYFIFSILFFNACQPPPERVRIAEITKAGRSEMIPPSDALAASMEEVLEGVRISACGISFKEGENGFYFLDMQGDRGGVPVRLGIVLEEAENGLYLTATTCLHQCSPEGGPNPCKSDCKQIIRVPCEENLCHCSGSGECYESIFRDQQYDLRPVQSLVGSAAD